MDTIYALASARGKAGVSIVRISGSLAHVAAQSMMSSLPDLRHAAVRKLRGRGVDLDEALVLLFEAGSSFTGEDVVELHLHGSHAVIAAVLGVLSEQPGLRLAEPGEFTRRALENGCLDLTQVEGLADLIDSETEAQRIQALRVLSGAIGTKVDAWRRDLIRAAALIEATIDFADEDVPVDVVPEVSGLVGGLLLDLKVQESGGLIAERVRDGFEVAIVGSPNSGKSTLINNLAGREAAITSEIPGTTRDVIEVRLDLDGLAVTFLDTAGLRDTDDEVEAIGVRRALDRASRADIRVLLDDGGGENLGLDLTEDDIVVIGKCDKYPGPGLRVSGLSGEGIAELMSRISGILTKRTASAGIVTRHRHRRAIGLAIKALEAVNLELGRPGAMPELIAEELRNASRALEALVGRVDAESLLEEIFSSFCIGK